MTNEELAAAIQAGDREKLILLWTQVARFVSQQAGKRARALGGFGGVTAEDLYQSGFLALVAAVDSYDPTAGRSFIGWLAVALQNAFAEAAGYRRKPDPLNRASSLDVPMDNGEGTGDTFCDLQPDPDAALPFEAVEAEVWREQLHEALDHALGTIPEPQADALRRRFWQGQTLAEIGAAAGVSLEAVRQRQDKGLQAMRRPQIRRELEQFIEEGTNYFLHIGVRRCTAEHTSAVEEIVLKRERMAGA